MHDDVRQMTFCVHCGPNVRIDDDGTCSSCGADAYGNGIEYIERLREQVAEKSEALEIFQGKLSEACGMLADNAKTIGQLRVAAWKIADEREEAEARVEELEKELLLEMNANEEKGRRIEKLEAKVSEQVRLRAHELRTFHPEDHVTIPNDCIDKAWAKIQRARPLYHRGMERALEIIGIVDDGEGGWRMEDE